jgi:hypothetical protein
MINYRINEIDCAPTTSAVFLQLTKAFAMMKKDKLFFVRKIPIGIKVSVLNKRNAIE